MINLLFYSRNEIEPDAGQALIADYMRATAKEMDVDPESIAPLIEGYQNFPGGFYPNGDFIVAKIVDELAGCVGIHGINEFRCEMRSLWVEPGWRGHGVASSLIEASLDRSVELGFQSMGLDVLPTRQGAIALYRKLGFEDCPCFHEYEFEMLGLSKSL